MKFNSLEQFSEDLKQAVNNGDPFCAVSIGDGEAIFLLGIPYDEPEATNGVRHNFSNLENFIQQETLKLLPTTDYIMAVPWNEEQANITRKSHIVWEQNIYSYPYVMAKTGAMSVKLTSLFDRYQMPYSGHLFKPLEGKRIVLVGHHAPDVDLLYKRSKQFHEYYNCSGLDKVNIVTTIGCSRTHSILEVQGIVDTLETIKDSYDAAIISIGIPANWACLKVKSFGKIAIDLGQGMSALAGYPDLRRMFMGNYLLRRQITDV